MCGNRILAPAGSRKQREEKGERKNREKREQKKKKPMRADFLGSYLSRNSILIHDFMLTWQPQVSTLTVIFFVKKY